MISQMTHEGMEQGHAMAGTFQIQRHRNSENLHLRLMGVFDGDAALLLAETVNENRPEVGKIFVHTAGLEQVLDSGAELFGSYLSTLERPGAEIIFTGEKGGAMAIKAPGIRCVK